MATTQLLPSKSPKHRIALFNGRTQQHNYNKPYLSDSKVTSCQKQKNHRLSHIFDYIANKNNDNVTANSVLSRHRYRKFRINGEFAFHKDKQGVYNIIPVSSLASTSLPVSSLQPKETYSSVLRHQSNSITSHNRDYVGLKQTVSKKDIPKQNNAFHAFTINGTSAVEAAKLTDFADAKKRGTSAHIIKLNTRHDDKVRPSDIVFYLQELSYKSKPLKDSSLKTLAFGLKKAYIEGLGDRYSLEIKYKIDQAFLEFTKRNSYKGDPVTKSIPISEICKLCDKTGLRTALLIDFLSTTGIRVSEALNIKLSDIVKYDNHYVLYGTAKGGRAHTFKAPINVIEGSRIIFRGSKYLFETSGGKKYSRQEVYNMIAKSSLYHLGYRITPHMLRHSWATHMVSKYPEDLAGIQKQGAWQSIDTLYRIYVHNTLDVSKLPVLMDYSSLRIMPQASAGIQKEDNEDEAQLRLAI